MSHASPKLADSAKRWAVEMTEQPSVTGSAGEEKFGYWLEAELRGAPAFRERTRIWTIPVASTDARTCVAMLVRGEGRRTIILTGHFDTVSVEDYDDLRELATRPHRLKEALLERLRIRAESASELRALADLTTDAFIPGRGLLDMKAGLAAGLAAAEAFAEGTVRPGNILFVAVPDEERNSDGARCAAQELPAIATEHDLEFVAAINLDAMADDGDGSAGRIIALGTVGKVLPTAFVTGIPTHGGYPLNGFNATTLAAAIAARIEWAPELADNSASQPGTPPTLLSLRDGKVGYDVTTPATAFATWNVLNYEREPQEVLDIVERLCLEAASTYLAELRTRASASRLKGGILGNIERVPIYRYEHVEKAAQLRDPNHAEKLKPFRNALACSGQPLPEQCRLMTERLWAASGLAGPAIVTGFGSIPYLSVKLSQSPNARRLARIVADISSAAESRYGVPITCTDYFTGISDVSFFGEGKEAALDTVRCNTPIWADSVRWPEGSGIGGVPTVNVGPWGRDYHTPLERLHAGYAFDVLPRVLLDIIMGVLPPDEVDAKVFGS